MREKERVVRGDRERKGGTGEREETDGGISMKGKERKSLL